jgi:hypothetical protein
MEMRYKAENIKEKGGLRKKGKAECRDKWKRGGGGGRGE